MNNHPNQPETISENQDLANMSDQIETNDIANQPNSNLETSEDVNKSEFTDQESASTPADEQSEELTKALQEQVEYLKQQLNEQNKQTEAFKAQYVRIAADFDNFRKRSAKEKENLKKQAKRNTINELLSVVDNFERARTQIKPANDGEMAIHKSYQGVYKSFVDSLKRVGVSAMRPEGQPFDPNYHEAMLREPTDEYPEGIVIEQLVRGYLLEDQVLRHAMVKVAVPAEPTAEQSEQPEELENLESTES